MTIGPAVETSPAHVPHELGVATTHEGAWYEIGDRDREFLRQEMPA